MVELIRLNRRRRTSGRDKENTRANVLGSNENLTCVRNLLAISFLQKGDNGNSYSTASPSRGFFFSSAASSSAYLGEPAGEKPSIMVVTGVEPQNTRVPKHRSMT